MAKTISISFFLNVNKKPKNMVDLHSCPRVTIGQRLPLHMAL